MICEISVSASATDGARMGSVKERPEFFRSERMWRTLGQLSVLEPLDVGNSMMFMSSRL
jgi:hypothetical protein